MAGNRFTISTEGTVIALVGTTLKTVLQVKAGANSRLKLKRWGVYFDGASATAVPVLVELVVTSTDGTSTSVTPRKITSATETVQATAGKNFTVEPSVTNVVENILVHPQQGYVEIVPEGFEIQVAGGSRLAMSITAPAAVNCQAEMMLDE